MTSTIQPPLLAWAWRIAVGDPATEPGIRRHHEWLETHRDLEGDGLLWIVQPDESGLDDSPKFDRVWGWRAHARLGFPGLIRRNRGLGWDAGAIRDEGGPVLCEIVTNVLWGLARLAAGEPSITPALVDRLWDDERGLFLDEVQPGGQRPVVETWAALAPLALPDLPEAIGRRLVEEHLLDPARFWLPVPPPSVSADETTFVPGATRGLFRRYWRGPTWVNSAWLLWLGLQRLGYMEPAERMAAAVTDTVSREGLREYYDPRTGAGLGATDFAWTSLVMELADPDPASASSHVYPGARQLVAHAQTANALRSELGADGVPMTLPLEVVSRIRSAALSWAAAPFTFARSNVVRERVGRSARPAFVPITIGVSSIHSAVA
jgi:hypothetical protein